MSKSVKITLSKISGTANAYYDMQDQNGNIIFSNVYGASLSNGITYSVLPTATSFTITSHGYLLLPSDVSGLKLWLKADSLNLTNGSPVTRWADSSALSNDATQSQSIAPTYISNQINGNPVVRFNGTTNFLALTNFISYAPTFSVFTVYKKRTAGVSFFTLSATASNDSYVLYDYTDGFMYTFTSGNNYTISSAQSGDRTSYSITSQVSQSGSDSAWVNGVNINLTNQSGAGVADGYKWIGHRTPGGEYADGDLAEIIFYSRVLTTTERQNIEVYLNSKYVIY